VRSLPPGGRALPAPRPHCQTARQAAAVKQRQPGREQPKRPASNTNAAALLDQTTTAALPSERVTPPTEHAGEPEIGLGPGLQASPDGKHIHDEGASPRRVAGVRQSAGSLAGVWPPDALERLRDEWPE
jgi:hypothetical protein